MNLFKQLQQLGRPAVWMLPVAIALLASPAHAQQALPATAATLDICHDTLSGNWRYSGVVAMSDAKPDQKLAKIDVAIQNKASDPDFTDVYQQPGELGEAQKAIRFDMQAPPLILGTLRSAARISIYEPDTLGVAAQTLEHQSEFTASVCGCGHPSGCNRTQGYWGNKPNVVWPAPHARDALFFSSGLTWQQVFDTPPAKGNAYLILAHQFIAATLNHANGASAPAGVHSILTQANTFFSGGTTLTSCQKDACATQKAWAAILDTYNNGLYPGAPKACPE